MSDRTTIVLGAAERRAARRLATRWGVTPSEAIRRAILRVAAEELDDVRQKRRRLRVAAFDRLIELSRGQDLDAELRRIREDRDNW